LCEHFLLLHCWKVLSKVSLCDLKGSKAHISLPEVLRALIGFLELDGLTVEP
jgi:hypothetical protein